MKISMKINPVRVLLSLIFFCVFLSPQFRSFASDAITPAEIFAKNSASIVTIGALAKKFGRIGTGFVVSQEGLILTNNHVLDENDDIYVKFNDNKFYKGRVVDFDDRLDIALVKIDRPGSRPLKLGNSDSVRIGERILAIGNPLGLECTVSDGLISAIRETDAGTRLLQISAPISTGSSGGPLFNMSGEVIGVTSSAASGGQNLNFAVPINYAKLFLAKTFKRTAPSRPNAASYTVAPDDTLFGISKKFGTTIAELIRLNGLSNGRVTPGQKLKIPSR